MIKKFILLLIALTFISAASASAAQNVLLDRVDFATTAGVCNLSGWGATTSGGYYGGRQTDSCVVRPANTDDSLKSAEVLLLTPRGSAKNLTLRHLDGIADDSFKVEVQHANGEWVLAGSYTDSGSSEIWKTTNFDLSSITLGRGRDIPVRITATGAIWSGKPTWGQLAIDWIELWGNGQPR
jgi:opacity protein-like surface antigen